MTHFQGQILTVIASAFANSRGGERGVPPHRNVLDLLLPNQRAQALERAAAVVAALEAAVEAGEIAYTPGRVTKVTMRGGSDDTDKAR